MYERRQTEETERETGGQEVRDREEKGTGEEKGEAERRGRRETERDAGRQSECNKGKAGCG